MNPDRGKVSGCVGRFYLLGIVASVFYRESDVTLTFKAVPSSLSTVEKTQEMTDLRVVYKVRTIMETIERRSLDCPLAHG